MQVRRKQRGIGMEGALDCASVRGFDHVWCNAKLMLAIGSISERVSESRSSRLERAISTRLKHHEESP